MLTDKDIEKMIEQQKAKNEDKTWKKLEASIEWKEKKQTPPKKNWGRILRPIGVFAAAVVVFVAGVWVGGSFFLL